MRHVEAAVLGALLESPATELDVSLDLCLDERNRIVMAAIERVRRRGRIDHLDRLPMSRIDADEPVVRIVRDALAA